MANRTREPRRIDQLDRGIAEDSGVDIRAASDTGERESLAKIGDACAGNSENRPVS